MEPIFVGAIGLVVFVLLILMGVWIAFAGALVGLIGIWVIGDWTAVVGAANFIPFGATASYTLSVIPVFIIMGYFAYYGGLTGDIFFTARQWLGQLPGGLAVASCFGCAGFGAVCGSSTAASAVIGRIAIPEMRKYGYDSKLAAGTVAASGTMASMIPPSILMVMYGVITEQPVGSLLIAGFIPGFLQAVLYSAMIIIRCRLNPALGSALPAVSWKERVLSLRRVWGTLLLMALVLGGMYGGFFTPTEAGGMGASGALLIALGLRKLTWANLKEALLETGKTTAMVFATLVGILILLRLFALSGISKTAITFALGLPWPPMGIMAAIIVIYLFLGMFVTPLAMLMLTLPFILPVLKGLGFDLIWFGVLAVRLGETAFITPPVAQNIFAVKAVTPDMSTDEITRGTIPFILVDLFNVIILVLFPIIATWLPSTMRPVA